MSNLSKDLAIHVLEHVDGPIPEPVKEIARRIIREEREEWPQDVKGAFDPSFPNALRDLFVYLGRRGEALPQVGAVQEEPHGPN